TAVDLSHAALISRGAERSESGRHSPSSLFPCLRGLRPLPVPEVNSGTFTPGFGAPTPKRLRGRPKNGQPLRVWPAFAVQPLPLSQGAPPPPGAGSKFRHLHPRFRGPNPETTSRPTEKRSASQPEQRPFAVGATHVPAGPQLIDLQVKLLSFPASQHRAPI